MALDVVQNYEGVSTTSNVTPTLGLNIGTGYLSGWTITETAGSPAAATVKIRDRYAPLGAIASALDGAAGNVTIGLHMFMTTIVTKHGETFRPAQTAYLEYTSAGTVIVNLTGIPTAPVGATQVLGRRVYVTKAGAPATGVMPSTAQWFRSAPDQSTTIAAAMTLWRLPQPIITVASIAGFATATAGAPKNLLITGKNGPEIVTYTGSTGATFTGCTGGTGLLTTGDTVTQPMIADSATTTTFAFNIADGSLATNPGAVDQSGPTIAFVKLAAGQAVGDPYGGNTVGATNGGGFYVEVASGTVDWTLRGQR